MPGELAGGVRLLDDERTVPHQDVGSDDLLDHVEHGGEAHELVDHRQREVRLEIGEWAAVARMPFRPPRCGPGTAAASARDRMSMGYAQPSAA